MAPNMKAIERLEGVENRLHDTEKDFENSRKEAKKAKDKFQTVKDKRYIHFFSGVFVFIMKTDIGAGMSCSTRRSHTYQNRSVQCTRTSPRAAISPWVEPRI